MKHFKLGRTRAGGFGAGISRWLQRGAASRAIWSGKMLLCVMGMSVAVGAHASLTIQNSQVSAGHYIYQLSYADLATSTKVNADAYSQSNVSVYQEGGATPRSYLQANGGQTTASIVYKFDFTGTFYLPGSVAFTDAVYLNNAGQSNSSTITTAWSLDGVSWTTFAARRPPDPRRHRGPA